LAAELPHYTRKVVHGLVKIVVDDAGKRAKGAGRRWSTW
jgi:hypothetical protein